jgi:probable F420-dependent oxidoreductase
MVIAGQDGDSVRSGAEAIEAAGLHSVWVGDHIAFYVPILESLTLLSFVAAATRRVRLCTGIYLAPLRHPTTTAKVASTLDVLSGGRLTLGVGVGGEFPAEFEACGVPVAERGPRTDEAIEVMRRLWSEDGVEHHGEHFDFGSIDMKPKPVQPGGPPIIVGGRRGPTFRRAGQLGDGYISHMCSSEQFERNMAEIQRHADLAGRGDAEFETASFLFTVLDDDYEKAHARAASMLRMIYNRDFEEASKKYCLLGRAEDCLEQMRRFAQAGSRHFVFSMLSDPARMLEDYQRVIEPELAGLVG